MLFIVFFHMVSATTNRLDYPDGYELTTQNMYCKWNRPSTFKQIIRIYLVKKKSDALGNFLFVYYYLAQIV